MDNVKSTGNVAAAVEKLSMGLLDSKKIRQITFDTKVSFEPIYSKEKNMHYFKITFGEAQDRVIFVSMRKDGTGVCAMISDPEYQYKRSTPVVETKKI